ncbi:MAG TPA: BON domain-containing protein [Candidatus Dormibacteraeota bacterium]|nr:BON domain-containing protein [Candidatus Dormibacteraeota bacterium]
MRRKACGAALFLAIAVAGVGCSRVAGDKQIATSVKSRLFSDPQLRGNALTVAVKDGVATISGQVSTVAARYEAFKVTSETPGVKMVRDDMTIEETAPHARAAAASGPKAERRMAARHHAARRSAPSGGQSRPSEIAAQTPPPEAEPESAGVAPEPAPDVNAVPVPPATAPSERITIPQGTRVSVSMIDSVNSSMNHTGDILHASLAKPLKVGRQIVAPQGANVYLRLVEVRSAGHFGGRSELRLELYRIVIQGNSYPLISNDYIDKGTSRTKRTVLTILGGSAIGAAIGAIAGGGKGAAIGAAAGGSGGAVYQGATSAKQVDIAPETLLKFKLEQPSSVALNPNLPLPSSPQQPTLKREPRLGP